MFRRLATVEAQMIMRFCEKRELVMFARTCRFTADAARQRFAWDACPLVPVKLAPACAAQPRSLLHFARVQLECPDSARVEHPVPARVHEVTAFAHTLTVDGVRALLSQAGCAAVTSLQINASEPWRRGTGADARAWVRIAARFLPRLAHLHVEFNDSIRVEPETDGTLGALISLYIVQPVLAVPFEETRLRARLPILREFHAVRVSLRSVLDTLVQAPTVREVHLIHMWVQDDFDWSALWASMQGVTLLQLRHCAFVNKAVQELASYTERASRLEHLLIRVLPVWVIGVEDAPRQTLYAPCLLAFLQARPAVHVVLVVSGGRVSAAYHGEHTMYVNELFAVESKYPEQLTVLIE